MRLFKAKVVANVPVFPSVRILIHWSLIWGDNARREAKRPSTQWDQLRSARLIPSHKARISTLARMIFHNDPPHAPVLIGADARVAADALVGPGVTFCANAVVGAQAVVMQDDEPGHIVVGNPARTIRRLETCRTPRACPATHKPARRRAICVNKSCKQRGLIRRSGVLA